MRFYVLALTVAVVLTVSGSFAEEMKVRAVFKGHPFEFQRVALSPDGKLLASGGGDRRGGELKLWDAATGKEIAALAGYSNSLYALAFSPDGKLLASGDDNGRIMLWDVATRKQLVTFKVPSNWVHAVAFSPDGSRLAAGGTREVKLWDVRQAREVSSFSRLVDTQSMAFSPDLKTLASPNYQEIELWDVEGGKERALLSEHRGTVHAVAFSGDGRVLAAASTCGRSNPRDWVFFGEVKLWDVTTGRERSTFKGDFGHVLELAISPDEKTLAVLDVKTVHADAELRLLDVTTGREVLRHKGKGRSLLAVTFAVDGTLFLVESSDRKTLKLWELPRRKEGQKVP